MRVSRNSILKLVDGQWVKVGSLSIAKKRSLAVSPSSDKVIVVGGWKYTSPTFKSTHLDTVHVVMYMYCA